MAGSPKKSPLHLILFFVAIAALSLFATIIYQRYGSPEKVVDTAIRTKLLQGKEHQALFGDYKPTNSNVYSASLYDHKVDAPSVFRPPWAELVESSPNGDYSFSWRVKLSFKAVFSVVIDEKAPEDFSFLLSARDGAKRFVKSDNLTIPSDDVILDPGIYLLKVSSSGPLDFFSVAFAKARQGQPPATSTASVGGHSIEPLYLQLDARARDGLDRFVELALQTERETIVKTPKGRVDAVIIENKGDKDATNHLDAAITLSGRTIVHLEGFPSLDVKIKGGLTFKGFSSFKLYKLSTKSGLYDFVFLSIFRDMGLFVPRQELVLLHVNGESKGVYILMETFSADLFTNQELLEGDVVGVDSDRMFFDYPYGATLKNRYFHRLKEPGNKRKASRSFLSRDFLKRIDIDHTAKYISMSALYVMGHGLGVDDLRFYSNPATGTFYPIPRDLNPGLWGSGEPYIPYLTHFAWLIDSPVYTIYPVKSLRKHDHSPLFLPTFTGVTDLHYSLASFLSTPVGLEAVNRYLGFYLSNSALKAKIEKRLVNTLTEARMANIYDILVRSQLIESEKNGVQFLGDIFRFHRLPEALTFSDGKKYYLWNIRTAENLDAGLSPSFLSPVTYKISRKEQENQYALTFLIEKKIFEILEEAGVSAGKKSYKRIKEPSGGSGEPRSDKTVLSMDVKPYGAIYAPSGKGVEVVRENIVEHLATLQPDRDKALVLFLVRNATDEVSDFRLSIRDAIASISPVVNKTFTIHPDPGPDQVTVLQVMNNQFLRGEKLRLLAFEVAPGKDAIFYTLKMPAGSHVFFPKYMYIPPSGGGKPSEAVLNSTLPAGFVERADGFHIAPGSELTIDQDVVIASGKSLHIGEGSTLNMAKGCSIKVTGSLNIQGTKERPVRFLSAGVEPWGGLYVGGDSTSVVKAVLKNVVFDNYGTFPKTRVAGLSLNGGISFYNSRVVIDSVVLTKARGEDAINFIKSIVEINGMDIESAFSDAVDMDFSNALIKGLHITESGGDGLDLSVSLVTLEDSTFEQAGDKGVSAGEMSRVYVLNSRFIGNAMGIANKDQSYVEVSGSLFEGNELALAEFIKKPSFGKPVSKMQDNTYKNNKSDYEWLGYYSY